MRKAIVTALFVTAFATSMIAQSKPNFSGTWKLNLAKSDFGPLPAPDSRTDVIDHNDPTMKINTSQSGGQLQVDVQRRRSDYQERLDTF